MALKMLEAKSFATPEERRSFVSHGHVDIVTLAGREIGRAVFRPGWRWRLHVRPIAATDSCEAFHLAYVVSGRLGLRAEDGTETEVGPGSVVLAAPGHEAWVVGNEECVLIDFAGLEHYAQPPEEPVALHSVG